MTTREKHAIDALATLAGAGDARTPEECAHRDNVITPRARHAFERLRDALADEARAFDFEPCDPNPGCANCSGTGRVVLEEFEGRPCHWMRCSCALRSIAATGHAHRVRIATARAIDDHAVALRQLAHDEQIGILTSKCSAWMLAFYTVADRLGYGPDAIIEADIKKVPDDLRAWVLAKVDELRAVVDRKRCGHVLKCDTGEEYVCAMDPAHVTCESDHMDAMGLAQWDVERGSADAR